MKEASDLDILVAERVMGWKYEIGVWWVAPDEQCFSKKTLPKFTTDIRAAWEVFEKLPFGGIQKVNHYAPETEYMVDFCKDGGETVEVRAATAPLAICLAALKSAGVTV